MNDSYVEEALNRAEAAFRSTHGQRTERDLDRSDEALVQLRKACRLLESCRSLRQQDGYYTSVIELSFGAIERSIQYYLLEFTANTTEDFLDHERIYSRAAAQNVFDEVIEDRFVELWRQNRSATYYRNTVPTDEQATAMFQLAETVHRFVLDYARVEHECRCDDTDS